MRIRARGRTQKGCTRVQIFVLHLTYQQNALSSFFWKHIYKLDNNERRILS